MSRATTPTSELPVAAHCCTPYLFATGSWIYSQLQHLRQHRAIVLTDRTENLDVVGHEPRMPRVHLADRGDLHGEMPERVVGGVGRIRDRRQVRRLEVRDRGPVRHAKERVEVRDDLAGGGDLVVENCSDELHAEHLGEELDGRGSVSRDERRMAEHLRQHGLRLCRVSIW